MRGKFMKKDLWAEAIRLMAKLRGDKGCPWDKAQSHLSLTPFLIEETYEVLESIEDKNSQKLCDELGDLLLQILFHSQIAKEEGLFDVNDVLSNLIKKIKRRHPHIFEKGKSALTPEEVLKNWEEIKLKEKGAISKKSSLMDGIPSGLPALLAAHRVQSRAVEVGFDWENTTQVIEKVQEELNEFLLSCQQKDVSRSKEELGDILFSLVNLARFLEINPEEALRKTIKKFVQRFKYIEKMSREKQKSLKEMSLREMDKHWEEAKGTRRNA